MDSKRLSFLSEGAEASKRLFQWKFKFQAPEVKFHEFAEKHGQIRDTLFNLPAFHSRQERKRMETTKALHESYHDPVLVESEDVHGGLGAAGPGDDEVKRLEQEREEEELRDVWLACPVIQVDEPNAKRDLEVYKQAINCLGTRLASADPEPKEGAENPKKKNDIVLFARIRGGGTSNDHAQLDRRLVGVLLDSIFKEVTKLKAQPDTDKLYLDALSMFERELRRRLEEILAAKVRVPDVIAIFKDTFNKEARVSQVEVTAKVSEAAERKFQALVSSVLKVKLNTKKQTAAESDPSKNLLLEHLSGVFNVSAETETEVLQQSQFAQSQKGLFLEMSTNIALIDSHPFYNAASFPTRDMLDLWKGREAKAVHSLLKKIDESAYQTFEMSEKSKNMLTGKMKIKIKVVRARGLTGKDKTGKSDPYVTIEYDKEVFSTNVIEQNLDPVWDEQITLTVKDPKGKVVLQVWDKDPEDEVKAFSPKFWKDETDDFLGMYSFTIEEILAKGYEPWQGWFTLQKRSKRSHISGDIYLCFQNVAPEAALQDKLAADRVTVALPHHQLFKYLMKSLLRHEFSKGNRTGELSPQSETILLEYGLRYRVGLFFHRLVYLGLLVELQTSIGVDINVLYTAFTDLQSCFQEKQPYTREERDIYEKSLVGLDRFLYGHLLRYRDCYPFAKPAHSIEYSVAMLETMYGDAIYLKKLQAKAFEEHGREEEPERLEDKLLTGLKESAVRYYNRMSEQATPMTEENVEKLVRLVNIIMDSLDDDNDHFERPFSKFQSLSISVLNSLEYMKFLLLEVENQVIEVSRTDDIALVVEMFELYQRLVEFRETFVDPVKPPASLRSSWEAARSVFDVDQLFRPIFKRWLVVTENQLIRWTDKALELDKFEPISDTVLHSTSVIDMISAFDQAAKFLQGLNLHNRVDLARLITQLSAIFSKAIQHYATRIMEQIVAHSQCSPRDSRGILFSFFKPKPGGGGGATPFEILPQNLVKLNNVEAVRNHLHQLYESMDVEGTMEVVEAAEGALDDHDDKDDDEAGAGGAGGAAANGGGGKAMTPGNLQVIVVRAQGLKSCDSNGRSDPYTVIKLNNKIVGRTRVIEKCLNPKWEDKFETMITTVRELQVLVYDHDVVGSDDLCGETKLVLDDELLDKYSHDIWLNLVPQGKIHLRLKFEVTELQDIKFQFSYMFRFLKRQMVDLIRVFIDQMTPFIMQCCSTIVADSRSKGFFKSSETAEVTPQDVQQALAPLIQHLETNLSLLSDRLYAALCQMMVKKIWKGIIRCFKLALIPSMEEDIMVSHHWFHKKVVLTQRQVFMIEKCLVVLCDFFAADGKGLEPKSLQNRRYKEMMKALGFYLKPTDQLMKVYLKRQEDKPATPDEAKAVEAEREVLLMILELRDDREAKKFVEDMLKELERERKWAGHHQVTKD